jgi:cytochrome c oxidase subunit II
LNGDLNTTRQGDRKSFNIDHRSTNTQGELMHKKLILFAMFAAILGASVLPYRSAAADTAPNRIEVTASRFAFAPGEITVKKNEPVVLVLKSSDVAHGLRFRELNLDVKVGKNGTTETRFTPNKVGDFVGHCSVFCGSGHGKMALTLHVTE